MSGLLTSPVPNQLPGAIREAARRCLTRVEVGSMPLGVVAEFLAELRDGGWDEHSIRSVDVAVRQVLMGMVDPETGPTFKE